MKKNNSNSNNKPTHSNVSSELRDNETTNRVPFKSIDYVWHLHEMHEDDARRKKTIITMEN